MIRPRVIPVLLLAGGALVKTRRFAAPTYIGDPLNAVRMLNDMRADELVFLDIRATREGRCIDLGFVREISEEAHMPFSVGGGIRDVGQIRRLLHAGADKVVLRTHALERPGFVAEAAAQFGSSTIMVCLDVARDSDGRATVSSGTGFSPSKLSVETIARRMEESGAGELIVQSIDRDGMMGGYDTELLRRVSCEVGIPVVALGGAGSLEHLREGYVDGLASAVAAGSLFVFLNRQRGVLINYPEKDELRFTR